MSFRSRVRSVVMALAGAAVMATTVAAGPAVALAAAEPAGGAGSGGVTTSRTVAGQWVSDDCEPAGTNWITRNFVLTERTWTLAAEIYADGSCTSKLLTFSTVGRYSLGEESQTVPGAREARFSIRVKQVTPFAPAIADVMNANGCGSGQAEVRVTEDISRTGCAALGLTSVRECRAEYDLLARVDDRLFFGARPADGDLCSRDKRPAELGLPLQLG